MVKSARAAFLYRANYEIVLINREKSASRLILTRARSYLLKAHTILPLFRDVQGYRYNYLIPRRDYNRFVDNISCILSNKIFVNI